MMNKAFTFRMTDDMSDEIDRFCAKLRDYYGYERSRADIVKNAIRFAVRTKCKPETKTPKSQQLYKLSVHLKIVFDPLREKNIHSFFIQASAEKIRWILERYLKEQCSRLKPPPPLKESALREAEYLAGQHREFAALCLSLGVNPNCIQEVQS